MNTASSEISTRRAPRARQAVTLYDVAAHAGVKPMTVSRTLNGGNVSPALRETVLQAVQELGYQPNQAARSIKSGKSRQVGVLVRNNSRANVDEIHSHPLAYEMTLGISEGLEEAGYLMSFVRLSDVDPEKHTQSSAFQGHLLDGLIVVSDVPAASAERLEELVPRCVWLDGNVWQDEGCVRRDEVHAGATTAREVAALGYREWIVLEHPIPAGREPHYSLAGRQAGIAAVAGEVGARLGSFEIDWLRPDFSALWPRLRPDVAVIGLEIYAAHELLYAASQTHLGIGRDFALACCDAPFQSGGLGWPHLARMSFDRFAMGLGAARMMIRRLDQPEATAPSQLMQGAWQAGPTAPPCP